MHILVWLILIGMVGVSWTQISLFPPRPNCFKRSICGGRADGSVCLNNHTAAVCSNGQETRVERCHLPVNGRCSCPHCERNTSTGACDPDTGDCNCLPGAL
jgi:hypothetical protein